MKTLKRLSAALALASLVGCAGSGGQRPAEHPLMQELDYRTAIREFYVNENHISTHDYIGMGGHLYTGYLMSALDFKSERSQLYEPFGAHYRVFAQATPDLELFVGAQSIREQLADRLAEHPQIYTAASPEDFLVDLVIYDAQIDRGRLSNADLPRYRRDQHVRTYSACYFDTRILAKLRVESVAQDSVMQVLVDGINVQYYPLGQRECHHHPEDSQLYQAAIEDLIDEIMIRMPKFAAHHLTGEFFLNQHRQLRIPDADALTPSQYERWQRGLPDFW